MTVTELYQRLKEKGYKPREHYDHIERGYCCAEAVLDFFEDFEDDTETAERFVKHFLELDRREVFRLWYGQGEGQPNLWEGHLLAAHGGYSGGQFDFCIDYILHNP